MSVLHGQESLHSAQAQAVTSLHPIPQRAPEAKHNAEEKCERPVRLEEGRQRSFETRTWIADQMASSRACIWLALVVCDNALYSTPQAFDIDIVRCRVTFSCFSR